MLERVLLVVAIALACSYSYDNNLNDAANAAVIPTPVMTPFVTIGMAGVLKNG